MLDFVRCEAPTPAVQVVHACRDGGDRVYWTPVWKILSDGDFALNPAFAGTANAAHINMNDAMWIADLLACGLIRASFVPDEDIQELRAPMRTRKQPVREQTRHVQRIQKTLEAATSSWTR